MGDGIGAEIGFNIYVNQKKFIKFDHTQLSLELRRINCIFIIYKFYIKNIQQL